MGEEKEREDSGKRANEKLDDIINQKNIERKFGSGLLRLVNLWEYRRKKADIERAAKK